MQSAVFAGGAEISGRFLRGVPEESMPSVVSGSAARPELRETEVDASFLSIFLQGKLRQMAPGTAREAADQECPVPEESGEAEERAAEYGACGMLNFPVNAAGTGAAEIEAEGPAQPFSGRLVRLPDAADAPDTGGGKIEEHTAQQAETRFAAAPAMKIAEKLGEMSGGGKVEEHPAHQAEPRFTAAPAMKIAEKLREMSGGKNPENSPDDGLKKEKSGDFSKIIREPAPMGTALAETAEEGDRTVILRNAVLRALDRLPEDLRGVKAGVSEIRIVLEPETLGVLTISVSRGANGISAKIKADSKEACGIITDQIQRLILDIEDKGITVENMDVVYGQMEHDLDFSQNRRGGRESESRSHSSRIGEKAEQSAQDSFFNAWNSIAGADAEAGGAVARRI